MRYFALCIKFYVTMAILSPLILSACMESQSYTGPQFYKLESFEATLLAKEEIARDETTPQSALTASDYKLKLKRTDGSLIVITRLYTSIVGQMCGTSDQMAVAQLEVGKTYRFPDVIAEKPDCVKIYVDDK